LLFVSLYGMLATLVSVFICLGTYRQPISCSRYRVCIHCAVAVSAFCDRLHSVSALHYGSIRKWFDWFRIYVTAPLISRPHTQLGRWLMID
jgi:hypothetical protein